MPVAAQPSHTLTIAPADRLAGDLRLPADVDFGLCALAVAAQSLGETQIDGLPAVPAVSSLATALTALGARVTRTGEDGWQVTGRGTGGLAEPDRVLDPGGSVAVAALLAGSVATHAFAATLGGSGGRGAPCHHPCHGPWPESGRRRCCGRWIACPAWCRERPFPCRPCTPCRRGRTGPRRPCFWPVPISPGAPA
ncbi:hypothetical protein [Niveispirillum fermenti]|uniref:hypothetical protein n=1 Tax=Niveispirillum fermenti TaxID=1233113 RepID=UPI004043395B